MKTESVAVLGSTGSIGRSTLEVLLGQAQSRFSVSLLAASRSVREIAAQTSRFRPEFLYLDDAKVAQKARAILERSSNGRVKFLEGRPSLLDYLGSGEFETAVVAFSDFEISAYALEELLTRTDRRLKVLVASKEPMVVFGDRYRTLAERNGHILIPLDSEPSAIFQCLGGRYEAMAGVEKIYLTASGGPFYRRSVEYSQVTPAMALKHPVWRMGKKITIDSATLVNKALELMEINQLFRIPAAKIEILVHPECLAHSMIVYRNGSILAQIGAADMKLPIHYGLVWPEGFSDGAAVKPPPVSALRQMNFEPPPLGRFPCLRYALELASIEKERDLVIARSAFLGADDAAVERFLEGRLSYPEMPAVLRRTVDAARVNFAKARFRGDGRPMDFGLEVYRWAREFARAGDRQEEAVAA